MTTGPATGDADAAMTQDLEPATLIIDVVVVDSGTQARMTVRPDPPGRPIAPEALEAAPARARSALAAAGVVHGIDEAAIATALRSPGEHPVVAAAATDPVPPRDAVIEAPQVAAAAEDPLHSVAAGTEIARRTVPRPGEPGIDVTGAPIAPAEPRVPDLAAGAGAVAETDEDGGIVIRAAIDGRPVIRGGTASVDETVRCDGLTGIDPPRHIHGTLVVAGDLGEGARVGASGVVVVGGIVERAHIVAERGIAVTGSCVGARIRAGAGQVARARLLAALEPALADLAALESAGTQLVESTRGGARPVTGAAAVRVLLEHRHVDLPALWTAALGAAQADGALAGLEPAALDAVAALSALMDRAVETGGVGLTALVAARAPVADAEAALRALASDPADVRAGYLQASTVEASGSLVITGAGTYNTDCVIGGDLMAEGGGATVRGGRLEVRGMVRVAELGAPGGARVEVHLSGQRGAGEHLHAGVAHPGAEILIGGRRISVERRTLNLLVASDDNSHVTRTGEHSER